MIEIVYKKDAKEIGDKRKLGLPKNVRQIGEPEDKRKIYIEDYVVTYLRKISREELLDNRAAVLLGHSEWMEGIPYLFIQSAIALKETTTFTDEVWADIYATIKEYFEKQDILGWFLSMPGVCSDLDEKLLKTHISQFGGVDKILMIADPIEGDEDFYAYENGKLTRQKGYCIFYERNEAMQRYMVEMGDGEGVDAREEFDDRATRTFRTMIQEKKDASGQRRVMTFLYTASTFLVMVVLVIGITLINNYEKMEGLELTLSEISQSLEKQEEQAAEVYVQAEPDPELAEAVAAENAAEGADKQDTAEETEGESQEQDEPSGDTETPVEAEEESQSVQQEALGRNIVEIPESYTVQKGDTLLAISRKIYGRDDKIAEICRLNGIRDSNHILVGQKLLLP